MTVPDQDAGRMAVLEARCEHDLLPLGIDAEQPRLAWMLGCADRDCRQSAFHVQVASCLQLLLDGQPDRWDSGVIASPRSVGVDYAGSALRSRERCWWRVQAWSGSGMPSSWSGPAWFEMGLLREADWSARWIGDALRAQAIGRADRAGLGEASPAVCDLPSPLLRREFRLDRGIAWARLYISGLGWHEAWINGRKVGDRVLDPLPTDYDKRVLYAVHDVTALLARGANAIGVMLGNGWYCAAYGDAPRLLCQLEVRFQDGTSATIGSDSAWRASSGPILRNSIYLGEAYDARLEHRGWEFAGFDDAAWRHAVELPAPGGAMVAQRVPPIRVREQLAPRGIRRIAPGVQLIEFPRLFAGCARVRLRGQAGERVAITYATRLLPDGRAKAMPSGRCRDEYILRGDPDGEWWEPRFTFHPVLHVEVAGAVDDLLQEHAIGLMAYNDVELPRGFACSNERLNRIHACVLQTIKNELYGIQMDCINSEHWGWLEPASNPGTLYPRVWMPAFWEKFLDDARAAQHPDGVIPDVVPAYPPKGRKTGDPCWAGNFPLVAWYVYRIHEDLRVLERNYPAMARWLDHLSSIARGGIVSDGYYGDHMLPGDAPGSEQFISQETPGPLLRTAFYYADARALALAAEALGLADDAARYARLAGEIRAAYNGTWYDAEGKSYAGGSQTANLASVALGLAPQADAVAIIAGVARDIDRRGGRLHVGNIGVTAMMETLVAHGQGELMYAVADREGYPGWGYMIACGATTIWESWSGVSGDDDDRQSMAMFTTIDHFLWNDLAGIRAPGYFGVAPGEGAYASIVIAPFLPVDLAWAGGSHATPRGEVSARWERTPGGLALEVLIPCNATADVHVPMLGCARPLLLEGGTMVWDGRFIAGAPGISAAQAAADAIVLRIGSGRYRFVLETRRS